MSFKNTEVAQLCPTLCDPMDCSPPGSSVHGIFQAWILERVAISFSKNKSSAWFKECEFREYMLNMCRDTMKVQSTIPIVPTEAHKEQVTELPSACMSILQNFAMMIWFFSVLLTNAIYSFLLKFIFILLRTFSRKQDICQKRTVGYWFWYLSSL